MWKYMHFSQWHAQTDQMYYHAGIKHWHLTKLSQVLSAVKSPPLCYLQFVVNVDDVLNMIVSTRII